jgi:hypothetical protein
MNKKIYIYKIIFITFFILIFFDIAGLIKNFESFVFAFFAILFIIHGIYVINFFSRIKKGFYMISIWFKKICNFFGYCFFKNNKEKNKKRIIKKTLETKKNTPMKKKLKK